MADLPPSPDNQAYAGAQTLGSATSEFNAMMFLIRQVLSGVNTATMGVVRAVHGGGIAAAGTVDVQPMVNQIDGQGGATPHGTIHGLPYIRIFGGANAVIIDPVEGDIGLVAFASRDISSVKASGQVSNPGSFRQFDMADGVFIGGWPREAPTTYVQLAGDVLKILSPGTVTVQGATVNVVSANVNLGATGGMPVARVGDTVNLTTGIILTGSPKVKSA